MKFNVGHLSGTKTFLGVTGQAAGLCEASLPLNHVGQGSKIGCKLAPRRARPCPCQKKLSLWDTKMHPYFDSPSCGFTTLNPHYQRN